MDYAILGSISTVVVLIVVLWLSAGIEQRLLRGATFETLSLRKIAANEHDQLGDISTLADPGVVEGLVNNRLIR